MLVEAAPQAVVPSNARRRHLLIPMASKQTLMMVVHLPGFMTVQPHVLLHLLRLFPAAASRCRRRPFLLRPIRAVAVRLCNCPPQQSATGVPMQCAHPTTPTCRGLCLRPRQSRASPPRRAALAACCRSAGVSSSGSSEVAESSTKTGSIHETLANLDLILGVEETGAPEPAAAAAPAQPATPPVPPEVRRSAAATAG